MYIQITNAARRLNMSRQWIHTLINRGEITTVDVAGHRIVVDDAKFRALRRIRAKIKKRSDYIK